MTRHGVPDMRRCRLPLEWPNSLRRPKIRGTRWSSRKQSKCQRRCHNKRTKEYSAHTASVNSTKVSGIFSKLTLINIEVAERHIPKCQNIVNRPKPPPKKGSSPLKRDLPSNFMKTDASFHQASKSPMKRPSVTSPNQKP